MTLGRARRAVALVWALSGCLLDAGVSRLCGPLTLERRALWLQRSSRRVLASLGIHRLVEGQPPLHGLVVSNHLSYLDIAILSAAMPCSFVSKKEVTRWPYFGWAARTGGTLFLDRSSRSSANLVAKEMTARLVLPPPVLLFPEGTSTDGTEVLRFHTRLFQPAITTEAPVAAAAIRYRVEDCHGGAIPERELCWYGDETFVAHLWRTLRAGRFTATVRFGEPHVYADAREAARQTHAEVEAMRAAAESVRG